MYKNTPRASFWNITVEKPVFFTVVIYLILVALMEFIIHYVSLIYGALGNALLIFILVNHTALGHKTPLYRILPAITLIPFIRLLSVTVPVPGWPPQIAYLLFAAPLFVSVGIIVYSGTISLATLGLSRSSWQVQVPIALSGLPLGFIGFLILHPAPLFLASSPVMWAANLLIVLVLIAFAEEIVFRGLFLQAMIQVSENFALLVSGILYGVMQIGSHSLVYAIFMGLVGWLFARFALQTKSLWGVIIAHFLLTAGMGLVWPLLF